MSANSDFRAAEGKKAVLAVYDSLLRKWPVPYEKINIKTRHGGTFAIAA